MATLVLWIALLQSAWAGVHPFHTQVSATQLSKNSAVLLIKTALVASEEYPGLQAGTARLQSNNHAVEMSTSGPTTVEVLCLSRSQTLHWQHFRNLSKLEIPLMCCEQGENCTPGLLNLPAELRDPEIYFRYDWNRTSAGLDWSRQCNESGVHSLIIGTCSSTLSLIQATGSVEIRNPFGYMSGEDYPLLLFYECLSEIYIVLSLLWVFLLFWHRTTAVFVQKWVISSVLLCCLLESLASVEEWRHYNEAGTHSSLLIAAVSLLNSWRGSFSRMLMLAMSQGLGVIRSSLGSALRRILMLGSGYFLANLCYDLALFYTQHNQIPASVLLITSIPVACFNAVFYYWIYVSLVEVKQLLAGQKQAFKLAIYERLVAVLVAAAGLALVCVGVEM